MIIKLVLLGIVAFMATLVKSTSGFGFGIVFMAIAPMLVPVKEATVLSLATVFFFQLSVIITLHKYIRWKLVILPVIFGIIASAIGVNIMVNIAPKIMDLILGIFLIVMGLYLVFIAPKIKLKDKSNWIGAFAGAFSGFMRGMFAVGSPPIAIYYNSVLDDPKEYQATIQTYFNVTTLAILITNIICHNFTVKLIAPLCSTILCCLIATGIGLHLINKNKISMSLIRTISYIVMFIAGLYDLIKFFI